MVVLMEGVKKALKLPNAVASLGKGVADRQVQLLQEWEYIAIMLDGEDKTQEYARELAEKLNVGPNTVINIDPRNYGFPSPDEATAGDVWNAIQAAWKGGSNGRTF